MTKDITMPRNRHPYSNNKLCDNLVLFAGIKNYSNHWRIEISTESTFLSFATPS